MENRRDLVDLATEIVAAYVSANPLAREELPALIRTVHSALRDVVSAPHVTAATAQEPAVTIKKSITPDYIICLEDGKKFKSLKRHLRTKYSQTPDQYREKWGLPYDYPMVAPNYAKERSTLAKRSGLGLARKGG